MDSNPTSELRICLFGALNGSVVGSLLEVFRFGYEKYQIQHDLLHAANHNENIGYMLEPVMNGLIVLVCIVAFAGTGHLVHRYFVSRPHRLIVFWLCIACVGLFVWHFETVIHNSTSFLLIAVFIAASISSYRLWISHPYSRPLLWIIIGITAVWIVFVAVQAMGLLRVQRYELREPLLWVFILGVVLIINFLFGTSIRHLVRQDGWPRG